MPWLINAAQLDKFRKTQKSLIIFDASYHLPSENRAAHQEFLQKHIPGAHFFDINAFTQTDNDVPNMALMDETVISAKLSALGVKNDYKIIFYDNSGLHSSCRALWLLKLFGHNPQQLYLLNGGLKAWERYYGKTATGDTTLSPKKYTAKLQPQYLRTLAQLKANLANPQEQVIDVRHPIRYAGGEILQPGLRRGHIPGAFSFPFFSLFDKENNLLPIEKIAKRIGGLGMDLQSPIICSCGSGVTAATLDFVLDLLGHKEHGVYDGSWSEWGCTRIFAGETGLDERPIESSLIAKDWMDIASA
jgi:thiosulfate/3-mercaptopyruvate sulfurtransferase